MISPTLDGLGMALASTERDRRQTITPLLLLLCLWLMLGTGFAQEPSPPARLGAIEPVPFSQLSDQQIGEAGKRALAIDPTQWKHAETAHFVLHYRSSFIASPVAVEAEFFYRVIMGDLGISAPPEKAQKNHLYLFEDLDQWAQFRRNVELEEWTGAVKIGQELFVPRNPKMRFKGHALGHEITHLLVQRHLGPHLPLWLEEGYAEDVSIRGHAAFHRARGYAARPRASALEEPMPLARLTAFERYPPNEEVTLFYTQAHRLVSYLNRHGDTERFRQLLAACASGTPFLQALGEAYSNRWLTLDALEADFKKELAR